MHPKPEVPKAFKTAFGRLSTLEKAEFYLMSATNSHDIIKMKK